MNVYLYIKQAGNVKVFLKSYIKSIFPFGKNELGYDILGLIARKGGLVEYQINNHVAGGTRRRIGYSLKNFLIPYDFLYGIQSKENRRNIKNAFGEGIKVRPRKYYLTFKGFIASLSIVTLKDNYVTKKYLDLFPNELRKDALEYISNEIFIYIFYNSTIGLILTNMKDLVFHIDDSVPRWNNIGLRELGIQELKELENKQQQLFNKIIKQDDKVFNLIEYWADALELITKYQENEKILEELEKRTFEYKVEESGFYEKFEINRDIEL